jgi:alanine racemase
MSTNHTLTTLTIDLGAIKQNYLTLAKSAQPSACGAVVKANAYGFGMTTVAPALHASGCNDFFVASLDEAIELRNTLSDSNIYIFLGTNKNEEDSLCKHNLIPILNTESQIQQWNNHAQNIKQILPAVIHIDTGMNRLGISFSDAETLSQNSDDYAHLDIKYILSHLACISELNHPLNKQQFDACKRIDELFPDTPKSYNNSGGILHHPNKGDLCRPGISLYGSNPVADTNTPFKNVVTLESQFIQVREVQSDATIGYGATKEIKKGTIIATVPVGYADGYIRSLSNNATAYVGEHEVKLLGRVSMDCINFDISTLPAELQKIGTKIELLGDNITVDKIATQADTISYEILTNLGNRFKRIYIDG